MNAGELFVNLGIKGSEKTVGALSGVTKGLGEAKSMSIEAKAAILGAVYAFERMMANSSKAGTDLTNFAALTGLAAKDLQQWQWAAMQAGDSTEDFTSSLKGVQQSVNNMLLNKSAPEYIGLIAKNVKNFDPTKLRDTFYLMTKLQEAAQNMPADLGTTMLRSFGLGDPTIAAMRRNAFTPDQFAKAPIYGDKEVASLDKANIAWTNLGNKVEMAFGHFNAKHGVQIVNELSAIADSAIHLAESLVLVSEQFAVFQTAGRAVEGIANSFKLISEVVDKLGGKETKGGLLGGKGEAIPGLASSPVGKFFTALLSNPKQMLTDFAYSGSGLESPIGTGSPAPNVRHLPTPYGGGGSVDVKQTVIFQGHHEAPKKTSDALKKAVGDYVKQSAAKVQGS